MLAIVGKIFVNKYALALKTHTFYCYREGALGRHSVGRLHGVVLHDELAPRKLVLALLVVTGHRDVEPVWVAKLRGRPFLVPRQVGHVD